MRQSVLAIGMILGAVGAAPLSAAIVYQQSGTVQDGSTTFDVPRLDLASGTYQVTVGWDQPDLAFFAPAEMGRGFSYSWHCGTPAQNCGGENGVDTLMFSFGLMSRISNRFFLKAGYSVADPSFPVQPATLVFQPEWFSGGTIELSGVNGPTPLTNYVFEISSVPEPTSWALMILGFGIAGATSRKRVARPAIAH